MIMLTLCVYVFSKSVYLHKCGKMLTTGESRRKVYRRSLSYAGHVSVRVKLFRNKNFKLLSILTFSAYKNSLQSEYIINGKRLREEKKIQRYF